MDSLNLMERCFTLHSMCLLKEQLGIAVENSQPLELVGLCQQEKHFYFGNLCNAFRVVVFNEAARPSHLHLSLSQADILWGEGSECRSSLLLPLYIGESCLARQFKCKRNVITSSPPLKFLLKQLLINFPQSFSLLSNKPFL